jgi:glycosyltransferase involved in cell wall biosynthesis
MRIAHIAPPWMSIPPRHYGGTEHVIATLVEEQIAQGHDVTLFAPEDAKTSAKQIAFFPRSLFACGVPWQAHLKAYYHLHKSVDYLKQHVQDFDILHTHLSSASDMYLFPLTEALSLPQVTTLHGQFPFDRMTTQWQGDADHYYMEWLSQIPLVAISEHARRSEQEKFPLHFIDVVYHGVDLKDFAPPSTAPEDFFLWVGRLTLEKGAHLAIEAARKAGVPLILAGILDQNIPAVQRYFREQIEPEIDGRQITYIGPVSPHARNDLLHRARGLLNPILWEEPFGMVMIEAMAAGCPVIAFRRGAAEEIVASGKVGFLVNNVAEMVESMQKIDTIDRNRVRRSIERHFSARIMAENYTRVYKRVVRMKRDSKLSGPFSPVHDQVSDGNLAEGMVLKH